MKKIYLLRHGRQSDARCNVNVALSKEGHRQAKLAGERLKSYGITKLYSSNLIRAIETAEDIGEILQIPFSVLDGIEEINFGELTGHTGEYIREHFFEFQKERNMLLSDLPYPGGESGMDVIKRAYPVLHRIAEESEETVAIVTHGGVIRSLSAYLLQMDLSGKLLFSKDLENCSITQFLYDRQKKRFYLERLNDYAHIEGYPELLRSGWNPTAL